MKLCKPCDTNLFNGADSCGICGNTELILLSSPEPKLVYDEQGQQIQQKEWEEMQSEMQSIAGRTRTLLEKQQQQRHRHRLIMQRHRAGRMAQCQNCMKYMKQYLKTSSGSRYCYACHKGKGTI